MAILLDALIWGIGISLGAIVTGISLGWMLGLTNKGAREETLENNRVTQVLLEERNQLTKQQIHQIQKVEEQLQNISLVLDRLASSMIDDDEDEDDYL